MGEESLLRSRWYDKAEVMRGVESRNWIVEVIGELVNAEFR
jgi:hypothetical protein